MRVRRHDRSLVSSPRPSRPSARVRDRASAARPIRPSAGSRRCRNRDRCRGGHVFAERADADQHEAGEGDQRQAEHRARGPHRGVPHAEPEHRRQAAAERARGAPAAEQNRCARTAPPTSQAPPAPKKPAVGSIAPAAAAARSAAPMTISRPDDRSLRGGAPASSRRRIGVALQQRPRRAPASSRARRARARARPATQRADHAGGEPLPARRAASRRWCRRRRPTRCAGRT